MASLESIPPDQRAVLQLVLAQGRGYDEIAGLLSIDRADVRERVLAALDALGPQTSVTAQRRALITDYLLGQLPARVGEEIRARLTESAGERAWARVIASELAPMASRPLPEIPSETDAASDPGLSPGPQRGGAAEPGPAAVGAAEPEPGRAPAPSEPAAASTSSASEQSAPAAPSGYDQAGSKAAASPPSARSGGCILLALGALIVAVVVVVAVATSGSSTKHSPPKAATPTSTSGSVATPPASPTRIVGRVALAGRARGAKGTGIADVLQQASNYAIVLAARGLPANNMHDAYGVWLYNSASDNAFLGFVNQRVGVDGKLSTKGRLPANVVHYKQLLVTLETQTHPHGPGTIVLRGSLKLT